ncbi:MAG: hypothetical protein FJ147_08410 [Deltaproteobacteria bacterium]|nr:hypothetical protein [Deltaproteobacteria bacterium]
MRLRTLLHALLALVILLVSGQIVATLRRPAPAITEGPVAPPPPTADESGSSTTLTPEASNAFVTAIAQNDLFSPDRGEAPPPPPDKAPETVPPPSHLKLVGVVLTRARAEAFLADSSQGNKVVRVKQGDSIGQYQLLQVAASEVKLSLGANGEVAPLRLNILDSATSQQAPHMDPNQPAAATPAPAPEEAQALRENIQRMQQRLRRIRRRAAREEAAARGETPDAGNEEEEEQDDEE